MNKYLPFYTKGAKPRFVEGDPFVTIIPLPDFAGPDGSSGEKGGESKQKSKQKNSDSLLALILRDTTTTTLELATALDLSRAGVQKIIRKLKKAGRLRRIGPDKGGHWEVAEDRKS